MIGTEQDDAAVRGEYLVLLRHGIRQSVRLAEKLSADPILGNEARGFMCRLEAIRAELDGMEVHGADRRIEIDPVWTRQVR